MRRTLLAVCFVLPVLAGNNEDRKAWVEARAELDRIYFDQLKADSRDRLFEAYGRWDDPEAVAPFATIISRYGTYMLGVEAETANLHSRIRPFLSRTSLTDQEVGLRNSLQRKIDKKEAELKTANKSFELVCKVVGGYENDRTIQSTLGVFMKSPTWRVRQVLAVACSHWHKFLRDARTTNKAFAAVQKLLGDDEERVRIAAARSLGHFRKQPKAVELLKKAVRDPAWSVRGAAVYSLGRIRTSASIAVIINAAQREKGRLLDDINKVLQAVTGKTFEYPEQWKGWWKGVGGKLPTRQAAAADQRGNAAAKGRKRDRFYGIPTNSTKICYIIDVSGSMKKEVETWKHVTITGRKQGEQAVQGKTRIEVAKNELKRAVGNLNSKKNFSILFFNHAVKPWRSGMTKASPANKKAAVKDIDKVVPMGATYTLGVLREAFTIAGVINSPGATKKDGAGIDTIFLVSDGGPTDNRLEGPKPMDPEIILDQVRQWNKDAGIVIHTIAVDTLPDGTYFLKQLAAQNHGTFVERKNPRKPKKSDKDKKKQ